MLTWKELEEADKRRQFEGVSNKEITRNKNAILVSISSFIRELALFNPLIALRGRARVDSSIDQIYYNAHMH